MKAYNFFLDIDDTLIPSGKADISREDLSAIKKARESGCKFFINTGRPYCDVDKQIFSDEFFDGILSGGDYAVYRGKPIYSHFMPEKDIRSLMSALKKLDVDFNIGGLNHRYYLGRRMPHYRDGIYVPLTNEENFEALYSDREIQKYVLMDAETPHTSARREILKYFNVITHPTYTEGFLLGHDKAFLIKKTEEALGLDHRFTVAVGDSHNDVDMMRYAAVSVAMGNAPDEVKDLCTFVTESCDSNGVARAIERLTGIIT
jgi:Cof subfamily protein (haloacid dehalogenase superfamily)